MTNKPEPLNLEDIEQALSYALDLLTELKHEIRKKIKSACEFYLKYKDKPALLLEENPRLIRRFPFVFLYRSNAGKYLSDEDMIKYREWLFKRTFKGHFRK